MDGKQQLTPEEKAMLEEQISGSMPKVKVEKAYLCTKCHSTNPGKAEDHATTEDCLKSWQKLAAQSLAAIEVGKRKIKAHQRMKHLGFRVTNPHLDLCTKCLITGFSAYAHLADYFDTMPKAGAKGGLVDVRPRPSLVPRETLRIADHAEKGPMLAPLGDAPAPAPAGPGPGVEAGNLLQDPAPGDGVGEGGPRGS